MMGSSHDWVPRGAAGLFFAALLTLVPLADPTVRREPIPQPIPNYLVDDAFNAVAASDTRMPRLWPENPGAPPPPRPPGEAAPRP